MRVPIEWLKELVSFRAGPDQLANMLTMSGLETVVADEDVLDVDILPNRSDCWSIRGIAREISVITKFKTKTSKVRIKENPTKKIGGSLKVIVRDKDLCPRYMARMIENVKVTGSPEWLKKRLERIGMRPINNVVDAVNYLLHETGQPMHAFDANRVKNQSIIVRKANPGEKVLTLDGKEHLLDPEVLVIADPEKVIAVAGIMGCTNSEVSLQTRTIILESAYFNPLSIHKTSKQIKTRSESSVRFGYGVDFAAVGEALDRGAALIAQLGRGDIVRGKIDHVLSARKPKIIELRPERANRILGTSISLGDMSSILKRLGFKLWREKKGKIKVEVPSYRFADIEREIDLIEEIARIWGYNRVETTMPDTAFTGKKINREDIFKNRVREVIAGCGLYEAITYSMLGPKDFEKSNLPLDRALKISNPLAVEESIMRTNLLPGLLKVMQHNLNRQIENVFIFEIGKVFTASGKELPEEKWVLGGAVTGVPFMSSLDKGEVDFYYVKGLLENLFSALGIEMPNVAVIDNLLLQPGKAAVIEGIGVFGALHPDIRANYGFDRPVYFFEIDLEALRKLSSGDKKYEPLSKFPSISRDISMFIPSGLENQAIIELIFEAGGSWIKEAFPFDKYKDSAAYRVVYQNPERTLTEAEVNAKHQEVLRLLAERLRVRIR